MKLAKVNAKEKTVEFIELEGGEDNSGTLQDWYREVECDCVTHFYLYHLGFSFDLMFIMDDEGLFKKEKNYWQMPECHPVVGNALIYAVNPENGKLMDFDADLEDVKNIVRFL
jgi:hypothetical protein